MRLRTWCAVSRTTTSFTSPARSIPPNDIEVINTELALADLGQRGACPSEGGQGGEDRRQGCGRTRDLLERVRTQLNQAKPVRSLGLDANERALLRDMHLLTDKPVMYVANVDENGFTNNPRLDRVRELAKAEGAVVVPVCAAIEAEISQLDEADRAEFLTRTEARRARAQSRDSRRLCAARTADLLHGRSERGARLDGARGIDRSASGGRHSYRLRARLHPRGSHRL